MIKKAQRKRVALAREGLNSRHGKRQEGAYPWWEKGNAKKVGEKIVWRTGNGHVRRPKAVGGGEKKQESRTNNKKKVTGEGGKE